jgi:hypothetical protein
MVMELKNRRDEKKVNMRQAGARIAWRWNGAWKVRLLWTILFLPFFGWGILSLWYGSWPHWICIGMMIVYATAHAGAIMTAPKRLVPVFCLLAFLIPLASFFLMQPSHDRIWQPDVAQMPYAEITGNRVVVHNVRNCDYKTETDYICRYETRRYDLSKLQSVDLMLTDWGLKYIAHAMISFGFEDGQYLCFSIETRKEEGEGYSAVKGFFRQYELIYVVGDERDLVRLRTNFRQGEDVYLYRLKIASLDNARNVLMAFFRQINSLYTTPQWYNALSENCMTSAFRLARKHAAPGRTDWHWSVILNGFADRRAYENGSIDASLPFETLKRISRINERARAADNSPDFSEIIRTGLPGMDWRPGEGERNAKSM